MSIMYINAFHVFTTYLEPSSGNHIVLQAESKKIKEIFSRQHN